MTIHFRFCEEYVVFKPNSSSSSDTSSFPLSTGLGIMLFLVFVAK
ncbi:unnamed protein product [Schistosoma curassoni]|uniref:Uncharacterized protein n=1 Tax=Schistosoma curassoni TaxID=6186 RepID=A0A183JQ07_9TREM|nr:unnamed protein product [Schistosoma curassoni]